MFGVPLAYLKIAGILACVASIAFAAFQVKGAFDAARYANLKTSIAEANTQAAQKAVQVQKAQSDLSVRNSATEAKAQERIVVQTHTLIRKVPVYVTVKQDAVSCVPFGFVRLHDAAAYGVDPSDLELPAGKSDDACTSVKWSDMASAIAQNYGAARQNAKQLTDLQEDIRQRIDNAQPHP